MITQVTEQLWIDYDLDTVVFLDTVAYWIKKNAANKKSRNFHEGRYWTYNSLEAYTKMFTGWSIQNIRRIIRNCVKHGLLLVGNFNRKGFDRTGWYSLTDKSVKYYPNLQSIIHDNPDNPDSDSCVGSNTPFVGSNTPIPKLLPTSKINTISDLESPTTNGKTETSNQEIVDAYHEVLPDCPKVKVIDSKLNSQLNHMKKNWPKYQKEGKKFCIDSFKDYLNYIKQHFAWFIQPYTTESGSVRRNNLRVFTREINITKIVNGEFSGN